MMKPVSRTAYYCAGVRMADAHAAKPIVGDQYAEKLMGEEGMAYWEAFKEFTLPNGSNLARCYLIDQYVAGVLADEKQCSIILLGAGLDSRAFRLSGGNWFEIDEPGIIGYKNALLPESTCANPLRRIAIDFDKDDLKETLSGLKLTSPVVVIVEGVLMYLTRAQRKSTLEDLASALGPHILICDLMKKRFYDRMVKGSPLNRALARGGAHFQELDDDPSELFEGCGYQWLESSSTLTAANELGLNNIPRFLFKILFRKMANGYAVHKFRFARGPQA